MEKEFQLNQKKLKTILLQNYKKMKIILIAAGSSTRLGEQTYDIPKGLLKINDKSIIANQILQIIKENTSTLIPYNIRNHTGFLRNVIIRVSENTNDIMVNIVTSSENMQLLEPLKFCAFNVTSNVSATRSSAKVK